MSRNRRESTALDKGRYIAVHGIKNVNAILEQTVRESLKDIDFIEASPALRMSGRTIGCGKPLCGKANLRNEAERASQA